MGFRRVPVYLALGFFALQIGALFGLQGTSAGAVISDVTPILIPLAAGAACVVASRSGAENDRMLWRFLGLGCIAWALGDIGYSIYGLLDIDPAGSLTLADTGYLALIPLWAAALISHPSRSRRGVDRAGTSIDALTIVAVTAAVTAAYVLAPMLAAADSVGGALVTLAYPVGDLTLITVLVSIRARSATRLGVAERLIAAATVAFAAGDIYYARLVTIDSYDIGHPVDLAWGVAFVLIAVAAGRTLSLRTTDEESPAVIPVLAIFGIAGMVVLAVLAVITRLENTIILVGAVATGLLVVGRLVVLLLDRARLLSAYDDKVKDLEHAQEDRERFIATISHDLRSPLASISGFAELMREPEVLKNSAQVCEMSVSIERNARRLARLTEDLLCAGQFAAGHPPPLNLASVDLLEAANEGIADMGRTGQIVVSGATSVHAMADRQRLCQILVNLIENAVKHSGSSEIYVTVEQNEDGAIVSVADKGVGIAPERIQQIFDPFVSDYQLSSSVGLGLYVVRNLVAAMGGTITVDSELGNGTTFRVALPPSVDESAVPEIITAD